MITKTLNLDSKYEELFAEINAESVRQHDNDSSIDVLNINSIETFFSAIRKIAALNKKFLRLPLEEPMFEIDANTRRINVPNEFKANGLSVQKDHLAEIIFFRIDRYFDNMDFANCDIEINWKMGQRMGKTSKFVMATDIQPGYVIFGWPIDKEITEKSGAVTFAVELNMKKSINDPTIIYSFNTLPVTMNIKEGLLISDEIEAVSLDEDVLATLVNSSFGEGDAAVDDVLWVTGNGTGLVLGVGDNYDQFVNEAAPSIINLRTTINNGEPVSVPVYLFALGYIDSATFINYINNSSNVESQANRPIATAFYPIAIGSELDTQKFKYFVSAGNNAYTEATESQLEAWISENPVQLYIEVARIQADRAGAYMIQGQGEKYDSEQHIIGVGNLCDTATVTIPKVVAPADINITIPQLTTLDTGYDELPEDVLFLNSEGQGTLTASAVGENLGAVKFIWEKEAANNQFEVINEGSYSLTNSSELAVNAAGDYRVKAVNFLNGEESEASEYKVIKASKIAGKILGANIVGRFINVNFPNADTNEFASIPEQGLRYNSTVANMNAVQLKVNPESIVMEENGESDHFEYQWYKEHTEVVNNENTSAWLPVEGATSAMLTITGGDGDYYVKIKNNNNGSVYNFITNSVHVDDRAND